MKCKKDGCKASAMKSSGLCYFHNPEMTRKRKEASGLGGKAKRKIVKAESVAMTVDDIQVSLSKAIRLLEQSSCDLVARCRGIGYLSGILVSTIQASDFETRISALERKMATKKIHYLK